MLLSTHPESPTPKAIVSINRLPNYIDRSAPPSKTEPFKTVADHLSIHTLSLLVSGKDTNAAFQAILRDHGTLHYCRVYMKLLDIVSGDFFNQYIKTDNIAMISEGRPGIDKTYSLHEGVLRIEVDRPTFERLGLEGKVIPSEGRKHVKARYAVEINLRLPAMVRGKKGFERVLRAFSEVLNGSKAWLFFNVAAPADFSGPITAFQPVIRAITPTPKLIGGINLAQVELPQSDDHESFLELHEWLSLMALGGPELKLDDSINSYLSHCTPSSTQKRQANVDKEPSQAASLQWRGYLHPKFIKNLLIELLKKLPAESWLAITAHAFDGNSYTILKTKEEIVVSNFCD